MSVRVMTWVFQSSRATGSDRLVLLAIADRTNDEGCDAWPSVEAIAAKARMGIRTVQRSLLRLEALGELQVERRTGQASRYAVVMQSALPLTSSVTTLASLSPPSVCHPRQSVTPVNLSPPSIWRGDSRVTPRTSSTRGTKTSTHTPRAREGGSTPPPQADGETVPPAPAPDRPALDPVVEALPRCAHPLVARRARHVVFEWRANVPAVLHAEFVRKLGGDADEADRDLRSWYRHVAEAWGDDRPIGEDDFGFWRARWRERTRPSAPANRAPMPSRPPADGIWGEIFEGLLIELGRYQAEQWFRSARVVRDTGEALTLAVPDDLHRDWIEHHFRDLLNRRAEIARPGLRVDLVLEEAA